MATMIKIHSSREARESLGDVLARFRSEGEHAEPLLFGSHRRAEAAVIPYALYERLESFLEDQYLGRIAEQRIQDEEPIPGDEAARLMGVDPADLADAR